MPNNQDSTFKHRTHIEAGTIKVQQGLDTFGAFQGAAWYVALTKLSDPMFKFFIANQNYLFLVTLFLYFVNLIVYSINFAFAANKNAGKTANLAYRAFIFAFYLGIIVGAVLFGSAVGSTLYFAFCVIDPLVNFSKALFFGIKCALAKAKDDKEFFFNKTMEAVKYAILGGLFGIAMVLLYSVAGIPLMATAVIGIVFAVASILIAPLIRPWVMKGVEKIKSFFTGNAEQSELTERLVSSSEPVAVREGFYSHSFIMKTLKPDALLERIVSLRAKLESKSKPEEKQTFFDKLFSEHPKRRNKMRVLTLLENIVSKVDRIPDVAADQPLKLSDGKNEYEFFYSSKAELTEKLNKHVLSHYSGAYQSWSKDIGRVHACVNQAVDLLQTCHGP